jgi:hypothetical protein
LNSDLRHYKPHCYAYSVESNALVHPYAGGGSA